MGKFYIFICVYACVWKIVFDWFGYKNCDVPARFIYFYNPVYNKHMLQVYCEMCYICAIWPYSVKI